MKEQSQTRVVLMAQILRLSSLEGSEIKSLASKYNVSFSHLRIYLDCLMKAGLLKDSKRGEVKTTKKQGILE